VAEKTHPVARARISQGMTGVDLAREVRRAAERRGLRSRVDRQRVCKWETHGVTPDADSQTYIAEALGVPRRGGGSPLVAALAAGRQ